jgi:transposase
MYSNIKTLHTLKSKGLQKCGKLKYSKEEKVIDLKQYGTSHKIISKNRFKISGCKKPFKVNGMNQFIEIPNIEYANARLLNRADGYYIQLVCYTPKENKTKNEKINKTIGIDFGCSTSFTTSEGEKINISIQESERLKRLQKKFVRQTKGSKNWYKTLELIKKEYQKQTNRKDDISNKIVHKFSQYKTVVIQDEQLKNWSKNHHGKVIQHSVLGRVKSKLKTKENVVILNKTVPTTKLCTNCGVYHDELKVWDRTFKCECGVEMDRDVHASKNMVWFYENNVGVERTNIKRVEMEALVLGVIRNSKNQLVSEKHETYSL